MNYTDEQKQAHDDLALARYWGFVTAPPRTWVLFPTFRRLLTRRTTALCPNSSPDDLEHAIFVFWHLRKPNRQQPSDDNRYCALCRLHPPSGTEQSLCPSCHVAVGTWQKDWAVFLEYIMADQQLVRLYRGQVPDSELKRMIQFSDMLQAS